MRRVTTSLFGLLSCVGIGAAPQAALAQGVTVEYSVSTDGSSYQPGFDVETDMLGAVEEQSLISAKRVKEFIRLLDLDKAQVEAVWDLHEGYAAELRRAGDELREAMKAFDPTDVDVEFDGEDGATTAIAIGGMDDSMKAFAAYGETAREMQEEFLENIRMLLTEDQAGNWVRVERAQRRGQMLQLGVLVSGGSVDLVRIIDEMELGESAEALVMPIVLRYETDLDRILEPMERKSKEMEEKMTESIEDPEAGGMFGMDMDLMKEGMRMAIDLADGVKSTNERYARLIESTLPEADRGAFSDEVKRKSFPAIYKKTHAMRTLSAAEGLDDLDTSQRDQLKAIGDSFERERRASNNAWARAVAADEADPEGGSMLAVLRRVAEAEDEMGFMAFMGMRESDNVSAAREARKELDERTVARIHAVLQEAQLERLPAAPQGDEFGNPMQDMMMIGG